ncbi:MAG: hypothetical protein KZQ84_19940 [Candidatus Thiodiazotropha sp. (ex Lucinoma borealis)]|nr:hypothetical protein [Candidatus Thiodiazotropha sp. (ex Lucinoma borealis)]
MMSSLQQLEVACNAIRSQVEKFWIGVFTFLLIAVIIFWNHKTQAAEVNEELLNESTRPHTLCMERISTRCPHLGVKSIYDLARKYATKNLPNETYQLYPIPVRYSDGLNLVFLWGISRAVPGEGRHYIPPHWMVKFESITGSLVMEMQVSPADFNQTVAPGQFIGSHYWKKDGYINNRSSQEGRLYKRRFRIISAIGR